MTVHISGHTGQGPTGPIYTYGASWLVVADDGRLLGHVCYLGEWSARRMGRRGLGRARTYPTRREAVAWLEGFAQPTGTAG